MCNQLLVLYIKLMIYDEGQATVKYLTYCTRGVQYVMKTAQYIPTFYIYTLHNYFHEKGGFLAK